MRLPVPFRFILCLAWWLLCVAAPVMADGEGLDRKIDLPRSKGSVYKMLGLVTDRSGYLFVYDSRVIDNDKEVKLKKGRYTIRQAIRLITGDPALSLRISGNHILIHPQEAETKFLPKEAPPREENVLSEPALFTIEGVVTDRYNNEPISYATIGIVEGAIGTITNQNGEFRFTFPDSLRKYPVQFTHLGYTSYTVDTDLLAGAYRYITLEPKVIPLQEVIVRLVNPVKLLDEMLAKRVENNAADPVYHTVFYREGIHNRKRLVSLTEALFQLYKTPYTSPVTSDQVKLLKMRRLRDTSERDTMITKFKSGIQTTLLLDVVKNLPDFFLPEERVLYDYAHADIKEIDGRLANVVTFEQRAGITSPLFKGEIYIDMENSALLGVSFRVHPKFVSEAAPMYVERKSRQLHVVPQEVSYTISYKESKGVYYINHIRGDLQFRVRKKRQLFSTALHIWFEMATVKTETEEVKRFARSERIPTHSVFSETEYTYDKRFWEQFNIILPEESLQEAINKISNIIEETEE
ncbi:hypothetical protein M2480_000134 [Parabacteroides sp. PFB2-12]|uniref:carboxypeptidase-like regulatory domain-containing protein n=1 Tax=unclassified Parabacteroides TaxID=2649774 RepID=UPI0024764CA9|nr:MULTISPECIES: carboxypeptidase-like regulatory domain-containing protein [unclassified Parabacteroides]MDH6341382.1 hypothetical protein [Parabacteroides sp. PM6-13]MDH6389176.1 hypothetical protein [Parabacteroides sp. PFB2-12]